MPQPTSAAAPLRAAARLHHHYLIGLILYVQQQRGTETAAELVFRLFRTQHEEKFLPGLKRLGLDRLPPAVACAQYFYLANLGGGVKVEYIYESDRKAWIRYPPPRWIWEGAAICAAPSALSIAFPRGFHAQCGPSLGNSRLGFVLTKVTTDGQPGLEGYFQEYDRDLTPEERLRFAPDEDGPDFDAAAAPRLDLDEAGLDKARRNYALQYIRTILPVLAALLGEDEAAMLGAAAGRLVGMQLYDETRETLGLREGGAPGFAAYLAAMLEGCGDCALLERDGEDAVVRQSGWRLMRGKPAVPASASAAWAGLWQGALAAHDRRLRLTLEGRTDAAAAEWRWRIGPRT